MECPKDFESNHSGRRLGRMQTGDIAKGKPKVSSSSKSLLVNKWGVMLFIVLGNQYYKKIPKTVGIFVTE